MASFIPLVCRGDPIKIREFFEDPQSEMPLDLKSLLNRRDESGKSALDLAAMLGRADVIRVLIEYGADPNSATKTGYTALHRAASWGHTECVKILVDHGTDIQIQNVHGERAREAAARYGKDDCANYLDRAEAIAALKTAIQNYKNIITDPEKNLGRLNKEDKATGNRLCDEKNDWLMTNLEYASVKQIYGKKKELEQSLQYILLKLEDSDTNKKK